MLHIIGLAHRAQARNPQGDLTQAQQLFSDALRRLINELHPACIAEEDSEEALRERGAISIAKEMADERNIEHQFWLRLHEITHSHTALSLRFRAPFRSVSPLRPNVFFLPSLGSLTPSTRVRTGSPPDLTTSANF